MKLETAFTMNSANIKFGPGVTREVGYEMKQRGARRVMVLTDRNLSGSEPVAVTLAALRGEEIDAALFDGVGIEPTDVSIQEAIAFALDGGFDGFVAVGGGSTMDTAKVTDLYASYPADFKAYLGRPLGEERPIPGALKPLIAVPTTAGTGSETTNIAVFGLAETHAKTGMVHRELRPLLGIVDPDNTRSLSHMVAASTGWDVLCHALESYTAIPYDRLPAPDHPGLRPWNQGANPISDVWAARAIEMVAGRLTRVLADPSDDEARGQMMLAASYAGIGFGNAGVHLPHAMSYPAAGMVRDYVPPGYPSDHPIIPHGIGVALHAPAVFRFTASANPERHLAAARLMGVDTRGIDPQDAGEVLASAIVGLMRRTGLPNGLSGVGLTPDDVDQFAAAGLQESRLTRLSPRPADREDLRRLFLDSMKYW